MRLHNAHRRSRHSPAQRSGYPDSGSSRNYQWRIVGTGTGKESSLRGEECGPCLVGSRRVSAGQVQLLKNELHAMGIRIDQKPPDVVINRGIKGGLALTTSVKLTKLTPATVKGIVEAYGISNGGILVREDVTDEQLIDVLTGNRRYVPSLVVLNKMDLVNEQYLAAAKKQIGRDFVPVSAEKGLNMGLLAERIWETLDFIRIYLKRPDGDADFEKPLILPAGSTLRDVCKKIHPRFVEGAK